MDNKIPVCCANWIKQTLELSNPSVGKIVVPNCWQPFQNDFLMNIYKFLWMTRLFVNCDYTACNIEIINNTRGGIVIFFTQNKRGRAFWGANSSPGCRARRLSAELMLP